jgi:hypothetical protein
MLLVLAGCSGSKKQAGGFPVEAFRSRPDLTPPVVSVLRSTAAVAPGDLFIAPKKDAPQKGPEIVDGRGQPVWFDPVPGQATDFREQTYRGRPVLTFWEGPPGAPVGGSGAGHYVILDDSYREVATVQAGFGPESADLHEFQLTDRGTAFITAYRIVPRDLSSIGGPVHGRVGDSVVQEVDVATGRVLFTWHSLGHIPLTDSYSGPPPATGKGSTSVYDYFHVNSIDEEPDGNLLVSARNTDAVYEIDRSTGAVLWRLGGKRSSFWMLPGTTFAWQHDARRQPDGTITIFDDEASPAVGKQSRGIRLRVDVKTQSAKLVASYANGVLSGSQGNMQALPNGNVLLGWGAIPRVTEFAKDGRIVFDATFTAGDDSYRAYRFVWHADPVTRPAIAVAEDGRTVYASWTGATAVARWQVVGGIVADKLTPVGAPIARAGFETSIPLSSDDRYFAVEALDRNGRVLRRSAAIARGGVSIG